MPSPRTHTPNPALARLHLSVLRGPNTLPTTPSLPAKKSLWRTDTAQFLPLRAITVATIATTLEAVAVDLATSLAVVIGIATSTLALFKCTSREADMVETSLVVGVRDHQVPEEGNILETDVPCFIMVSSEIVVS